MGLANHAKLLEGMVHPPLGGARESVANSPFVIIESGFILAYTYVLFFSLPQNIRLLKYSERMHKDPAGTLGQLEKQLAQKGDSSNFRMLHAACLGYMGEFERAWQSLQKIDEASYGKWLGMPNPLYRVNYSNSILYHALLAGHYRVAYETYTAHQARLTAYPLPAFLDTIGTYHYFFGEIELAQEALRSVLARRCHRSTHAMSSYFLGRIELHRGNLEAGLALLERAADWLPQSFLAGEIARLARGEEWIPGPGAALAALRAQPG